MKNVLVTSLVFATACSGSPLDPGAGDSQGTGTSTLLVNGSAIATPRIANAQVANDFDTSFSVRIQLGTAPLSTGTVTMTSAHSKTTLAFNGTSGQAGRWEGDAPGYDEVYQLDVTSGTDSVTGVIVDGPDIQVITAPTAGATIDSTMPFTATWDRAFAADEAKIDPGDAIDPITVPDSGTYSVSAGVLHADQNQARTNTFRLTRTNRVSPVGAVTGSSLSVSVENELDIVAAPCPTC